MPSLPLLAVVGVLIVVIASGIHRVPEGHVSVFWRGGRLIDELRFPGFHVFLPIVDEVADIQITMQTDSVTDIPCGTSGGVVIHFDRIEVVNRLKTSHVLQTMRNFGVHYDKMWIFDKIHHEINQFCSSHTLREVFIEMFDTLDESLAKAIQRDCDKYETGIEIITVRVTKPRIPESVRKNYENMEAERAALMLATEKHKVAEKEAQTEAMKARINAEKHKAVREIELAKEIVEREAAQKMNKINSEILLQTEKAKADAAFYVAEREADSNKRRFTPEYLEYSRYNSIANNAKIFFGDSIPTMLNGGVPNLSTAADGNTQRKANAP